MSSPRKDSRKYLSPKEVAAELEVSVWTAWRMMRNPEKFNNFPVKRFGTRVLRIPRKEFFDWVERA